MDERGEKDLSKRIRKRKGAGWLMGSFGFITLVLSLLGIIGLILLSIFSYNQLTTNTDPGDYYGPVALSWVLMLSIAGIFLIGSIGFLSIFKLIAGIMIYKGKKKGFIIATFVVCTSFSSLLLMLSFVIFLQIHSIGLLLLILFSIVDIFLWIYLIYAMGSSWNSFMRKKKKSLNVA